MVVDHTENLAHKCWDCKRWDGYWDGMLGGNGSVIPRGVVGLILRSSWARDCMCSVLCLYVRVLCNANVYVFVCVT